MVMSSCITATFGSRSSSYLSFVMSAQVQPLVYSFSDTSRLSDSLAEYIIKAQRESVDKRGRFTVAISGGSLPKTLTALITKPGVEWAKWQVTSPWPLYSPSPSSPIPVSTGMFITQMNASYRSTTKIPTTSSPTTPYTPKFPSRQKTSTRSTHRGWTTSKNSQTRTRRS